MLSLSLPPLPQPRHHFRTSLELLLLHRIQQWMSAHAHLLEHISKDQRASFRAEEQRMCGKTLWNE